MNNKKIVFATNNPHKIKEITQAVGNTFEILSLKDIGFHKDIEEPYETLAENARVKSSTIYQQFGYNCFADDTGLEIDALEGKPGVFSARYAGPQCISKDNINKVLSQLKDITNRKARFRTVISLFLDGKEYQFEGMVEGEILDSLQGSDGFGYDPVFRPQGYRQSFAQMPLEEKNRISHRGQAVKKLTDFLKEQYK